MYYSRHLHRINTDFSEMHFCVQNGKYTRLAISLYGKAESRHACNFISANEPRQTTINVVSLVQCNLQHTSTHGLPRQHQLPVLQAC